MAVHLKKTMLYLGLGPGRGVRQRVRRLRAPTLRCAANPSIDRHALVRAVPTSPCTNRTVRCRPIRTPSGGHDTGSNDPIESRPISR